MASRDTSRDSSRDTLRDTSRDRDDVDDAKDESGLSRLGKTNNVFVQLFGDHGNSIGRNVSQNGPLKDRVGRSGCDLLWLHLNHNISLDI